VRPLANFALTALRKSKAAEVAAATRTPKRKRVIDVCKDGHVLECGGASPLFERIAGKYTLIIWACRKFRVTAS